MGRRQSGVDREWFFWGFSVALSPGSVDRPVFWSFVGVPRLKRP